MTEQQVTGGANKSARRWIALTPDRLVVALLVVEGGLLAGDYFGWIGLYGQKGWPFLLAVMLVGLTLLYLATGFAASLAFRRPFQFHLRTLLLLVFAVAGLGSWGLTGARESKRRADATAALLEAGLEPLRQFDSLRALGLQDTKVTDSGLEYLRGLTHLESLGLPKGQVSAEDVRQLQSMLPQCSIHLH